MKRLFLSALLMTLFIAGNAQLKIDGQFRPRFEYRDGYKTFKTEETTPAYFVTQRTRLNLNHKYNNITSQISAQDYRIWGESNLKSDDPGLSIFEAYFKIEINNNWSLTAGRQSFNIDNKRLFSAANWNQVSSSHDGVTIDYNKSSLSFRTLTAFNQASVSNFGTDYTDQINHYKFLNVIWLEKTFKKITLANLTITDGYQKEGTENTEYYRMTSGIVAKYLNPASRVEARGFYQFGKNQKGQDVNAYFLNLIYGYYVTDKINVTTGIEYMSGNDLRDTLNLEDNAFDILYGTKHAYNGIMDYFSTPKTTANAGLIDGYFRIGLSKLKNWNLAVAYHYFALANNYVFENEEKNKFLANEVDIIAKWKINDIVNMELGYANLWGSKTLEYVKGTEPDGMQHYFYTMIAVKPTFFKN